MIKIHRDNRVIFWLLIGGLVLNILWSLRLELQAKTTKSIVEKYHLMLNKNKDALYKLDYFGRLADDIDIGTNDKKLFFEMKDEYGHIISINAGPSSIQLGDIMGQSKPYGISLYANNKTSSMNVANFHLSNKGALLECGDGRGPFRFDMSLKKQRAVIRYHDSFFHIGKSHNKPFGYVQGLKMGVGKSGFLAIFGGKVTTLRDQKLLQLASDDRLDIFAEGDINIISKNGVVKINGKKIHMNK